MKVSRILHFNTSGFFYFYIPCPLSQFVTQGDSRIVAEYAINKDPFWGSGRRKGSGREERVKRNSISGHNFVLKGGETVGLLAAQIKDNVNIVFYL